MRYIHELIEDVGIKNILPLNGCPVRLHEKNKMTFSSEYDILPNTALSFISTLLYKFSCRTAAF